eukprot:GHVP01031422.1.p1 GENE.GHVP01031422.1~~GHVP01031422.1.p1  ORF type:complete len:228 (+),score=40.95 GHVP01031422.1:43-684(+)
MSHQQLPVSLGLVDQNKIYLIRILLSTCFPQKQIEDSELDSFVKNYKDWGRIAYYCDIPVGMILCKPVDFKISESKASKLRVLRISYFCILPAYRNIGIGSELLKWSLYAAEYPEKAKQCDVEQPVPVERFEITEGTVARPGVKDKNQKQMSKLKNVEEEKFDILLVIMENQKSRALFTRQGLTDWSDFDAELAMAKPISDSGKKFYNFLYWE